MSDESDAEAVYTTEFVNSLTPSGMPQHRLELKVGAIICCFVILIAHRAYVMGQGCWY